MSSLTLEKLKALVAEGTIDTVVVAMTDMQGRLTGKRIHGQYFLDEVVKHGTEGCNYLLAVDVDMILLKVTRCLRGSAAIAISRLFQI